MGKRITAVGLGVVLHASASFGQLPPQPLPIPPGYPIPPRMNAPAVYGPAAPNVIPPGMFPAAKPLPPLFTPTPASTGQPPAPKNEVPLPFVEQKFRMDAGSVTMKRVGANWQVWAGQRMLRDLANDEDAAKDIIRVIRELRPTEWGAIGSPRPVVEYGLTNGKPALVAGFPKMVMPIDLRTVRSEAIKGVWVLRDDANILFNFGPNRADADQAAAVIHKYGFNRIGFAGSNVPAMAYFFATPEAEGMPAQPSGGIPAALQEQALTRTGIPVPGAGFVGEMIKIDASKVEVRKDGFEWVVAFGPDIVARFGPTEWLARDAAKVIKDGRYTEFCRFGSNGLTFFLINGQAPRKVPFAAQGRRFDLGSLRTLPIGDKWSVTENGRPLFDVANAEEGETLIRLLKGYQFDQICQVGQTVRARMLFLARAK